MWNKATAVGMLATLLSAAPGLSAAAPEVDADAWKVRQSRMIHHTTTVDVADTQLEIDVYTEPQRQGWGRELIASAEALLVSLVRRFGPPPGDLKRVLIVDEPNMDGWGWNGGDAGIRLRSPADEFVLARQLVHYWLNPVTVDHVWLLEGLAHWEALMALRRADLGHVAQQHFDRRRHAAFDQQQTLDFALSGVDLRNEPPDRYAFGTSKAMLFAALIRVALGQRGYDEWVAAVPQTSKSANADQVRTLLTEQGRNADAMFAGWVDEGDYQSFRWRDLGDDDADGVPNALEAALGTDPEEPDSDGDRLADGYEYWHQLNPAVRDTYGDGKRDHERVPLAVDGLGGEWEAHGLTPAYRDPAGDGDPVDMDAIWFAHDEDTVYVRIDTASSSWPRDTSFWLTVLWDWDGDRRADFATVGDQRGHAWFVPMRRGNPIDDVGQFDPRLRFQAGRVAEMAIPRELLEDRQKIQLNVRLDQRRGRAPIDHTGGYWHVLAPDEGRLP